MLPRGLHRAHEFEERAGVIQRPECLTASQDVTGSNPVARSKFGGEVDLILAAVAMVGVIAACIFAMRMSYEKFCIRTRKPFRSWLGDEHG